MEDNREEWDELLTWTELWALKKRERQAAQQREWSRLDSTLFSAEYEVWKQMWEEYGLSL